MLGDVQSITNIDFDVDKTHRAIIIKSSGCASSTLRTPLPSTATDRFIAQVQILSKSNISGQKIQDRAFVVGKQSRPFKWPIINSTSATGSDADRCLQEGMGSSLQWNFNRRNVVKGGTGNAYKYPGTPSCEVSNTNIQQEEHNEIYTSAGGQHDCLVLSPKNGRNEEPAINGNIQTDMELSVGTRDHDYCRIFTQCPKRDSRLGVSTCNKQVRMETLTHSVSQNLSENGSPGHRLVCLSPVSPAPCIHRVETRPPQSRDRRNASDMVIPTPLCVSPILTDYQGTKQGETRQGTHDADNNTYLANPAMVCRVVANVNEETGIAATQTWSSDKPSRSDPPTGKNRTLRLAVWKVTGKSLLQKEFQKRLPTLSQVAGGRAQHLITNRPGESGLAGVLRDKLIHFTVL